MFRWLGRNLGALVMAFILAVVVWVSAVISTDPNEERVYPRLVNLEVIGLDPTLVQVGDMPTQVRITLNAPQSIWNQLNSSPDSVRAWIDLSGMTKGDHSVEVNTQITGLSPVQVIAVEPAEIALQLEPLKTVSFPIDLTVTGDPALGYRKGVPVIEPGETKVIGPESVIARVSQVRADLDVSSSNETIRRNVTVRAVDGDGITVLGVSITPATVAITQPINLLGGYRNVVVKVVTTGQVADGYWLTNIFVSPPNVTVFSTNPQAVNLLPGYVETNAIDLSGLSDDVDIRATLNLSDSVSLAGEESVLVRLSIAAREGSLPISLPIEVIGLPPELEAIVSPETVDLLLTGSLPILNNINPAGIRVSINLTGFDLGTYQVTPVVDLLPNQVRVASILPQDVEVIIQLAPTQTPTPSEGVSPDSVGTNVGTPTAVP